MQNPKLSIIMPVYNEINTIEKIIKLVKEEPHDKEIIIVDDNSTDGTIEFLKKIDDPTIKVIFNETNKGKGFCLRRAIDAASGDITIIQDADLEYYPDEYGILVEKIEQGKADAVFGTRFMGAHRAFYFHHFVGNQILNFIANILLNAYLTDLMTCYKAFKTDVVKKLTLRANRFGIEPEITAELFRRRYRVYEVPISYDGRSYEDGKKIRWSDFFSCVFWLIRACLRFK